MLLYCFHGTVPSCFQFPPFHSLIFSPEQGVVTNFEIFRMREKQVPVDVVEMKGKSHGVPRGWWSWGAAGALCTPA